MLRSPAKMLVFRENLWYTGKCESMTAALIFGEAGFQPGLSGVSGLQKEGLDI